MLSFKEYIEFLEIATDSWLTAPAQPVADLIRYYNAPVPGNLDLSNRPPTNNNSSIDKDFLKIIQRMKNASLKKLAFQKILFKFKNQ